MILGIARLSLWPVDGKESADERAADEVRLPHIVPPHHVFDENDWENRNAYKSTGVCGSKVEE
jgi:hypothetical protein